ncbi:TatD family hydrolase [Saxibacter everestensis]|uniref:TatD family hydrolase n=1 Tax=Saxibacter everestensis TaxID=2909229 RepID=A0ABY8QWU6_9MICO|nr:TatD family hydrolase [Brevibacteriaceae bacterium ZFBP1038]
MAKPSSRAAGEYPAVPEPLPHPIVDNHTHLDIGTGARLLEAEREESSSPEVGGPESENAEAGGPESEDSGEFPGLDWFLTQAEAAGVPRAVQIGCELPAARWTAELVSSTPQLLGGAALHPNEAPRLAALGTLDDALAEIEHLSSGPRMRVVGETGLDYFRTGEEGLKAQEYSFREHIGIAKRLGLALQIHDREAHDDVLRVLDEEGAPDITVFHCFSGDLEMAEFCAAKGWYLSFAGNSTFRNAHDLRAAAAVVPLAQILTETDAPFLTPHPHRGMPGGSYLTGITARILAEVRGEPLEEFCQAVWNNSERVYGSWE